MSPAWWDWIINAAGKAVDGFNVIEALFWLAVAAGFAWAALLSRKRPRWALPAAAVTLAAFGISDFVEARTGAWWRPWCLFVWKAGCLALLISLYAWHRREKRRDAAACGAETESPERGRC